MVLLFKKNGLSKTTFFSLAITVVLCIILLGTVFTIPAKAQYQNDLYNEAKQGIQRLVVIWMNDHGGELPILNPDVTVNISGNGNYIIDICVLMESDDSLRVTPLSCVELDGPSNDNCDGSGCTWCWPEQNYIWALNDDGRVYSTCVGVDCSATGEDGYQGAFTEVLTDPPWLSLITLGIMFGITFIILIIILLSMKRPFFRVRR